MDALAEGLDAFAVSAFFTGALTVLEAAGLALGAASFLTSVGFLTATGFLTAAVDLLALLGVFFAAGGALLGAAGLALAAGAGAGWASPRASRVLVDSPSGVPAMGLPVRELRKISHSGLDGWL